MNSIPCDIVLIPNTDIAQKAIAASQQLATLGSLFTLKDDEYSPHASLYMTQLKVAGLDAIKERLATIAAQMSPLDLTAIRYSQAQGFIDAEYQRTAALDDLQMEVAKAINPIRDGLREKDKVRMQIATGKARENFETYGYPNIGELFRPHVTLTRFAEFEPKDGLELPPIETFNGQFTKLGLFEMGDNGTCVRKIAEFEL